MVLEGCAEKHIPFAFEVTSGEGIELDLLEGHTWLNWGGGSSCQLNGQELLVLPSGLTECGTQWQLHNGMIEFVLESAPEGGNLEVWGANLDGCQGRVNVQYNATALGTYSGQFNLGGCEGHYVPFSVTFQDGSGTSVVSSDLAWGFMNGGTTCATQGSDQAVVPFDCGTQASLGGGLEVVWTVQPEGSNIEVWTVQLDGCQSQLRLEYNNATLGDYQGYIAYMDNQHCVERRYPISFSVSDQGGEPVAVSVQWMNGPAGGSTCASSGHLQGEVMGVASSGTCASYGTYDGSISVAWSTFPEGSDLFIPWADWSECGPFPSINFEYQNGTPGMYEGELLVSVGGSCSPYSVPFSFEIVESTGGTEIAENVSLSSSSGVALDAESLLCGSEAMIQLDFSAPAAPGCSMGDAYDGSVSIDWTSTPDGLPGLDFIFVEVCEGNGFGEMRLLGLMGGLYEGVVVMNNYNCASLEIPFAFNVAPTGSAEMVTQDVIWNAQSASCSSWGTLMANHDLGMFVESCGGSYATLDFGDGVELELTSQPEGADVSLSVHVDLCYSSSMNLMLDYGQAIPGSYSGQIVSRGWQDDQGNCIDYVFPFAFEVEEAVDAMTTSLEAPDYRDNETNQPLFDEPLCAQSLNVSGDFSIDGEIFGMYPGESMSVAWDQAPAGTTLSFHGHMAEFFGGAGMLQFSYSNATPGVYSGHILVQDNQTCNEFSFPLAFEIEDVPLAEYALAPLTGRRLWPCMWGRRHLHRGPAQPRLGH